MNTRLQVERSVAEMVRGVDIVEWMIRAASGERLTIQQRDVHIHGWAMEARIYAEDPNRNFMPSTGRIVRYARATVPEVTCITRMAYGGDFELLVNLDPSPGLRGHRGNGHIILDFLTTGIFKMACVPFKLGGLMRRS